MKKLAAIKHFPCKIVSVVALQKGRTFQLASLFRRNTKNKICRLEYYFGNLRVQFVSAAREETRRIVYLFEHILYYEIIHNEHIRLIKSNQHSVKIPRKITPNCLFINALQNCINFHWKYCSLQSIC